jgi:PHP family Zn ribbon phosphoesterase
MPDTGLGFRKLDLHLHTPASIDFVDRSVTSQRIVEKAIAKGLDGIAITDHNSGEWVDKVKDAAKGTSLVVFPGVEISCEGGREGIHLIALFDVDKDSAHVSGLLSSLNITPDMQGKTESLAKGTVTEIIDKVQSKEWQGIAIPAHASSSKGILSRMRGEQRTRVIRYPSLIAVEATCFEDEDLKNNGKRAVDLLNGTDPVYQRKIAVYQASDNPSRTSAGGHGLNGIGSRCAHFKMERINLDSLRQCFLDPDVRIRQDFEFAQEQYPRIDQVRISGGFLDGQQISFHEGLNSIIGGKGAGKSLLVELLRFTLDQAPSQTTLKDDHGSKLEKKLGHGGHVEVTFVDSSGISSTVRRIYESGGSRFEGEVGHPSHLYPVLFLSQNEIIGIAEDASRQLTFIDRFLDFRVFQDQIQAIGTELKSQDRALAEAIWSVEETADLDRKLTTNAKEIERLSTKLSAPVFDEHKSATQKTEALSSLRADMSKIREALEEAKNKVYSVGESSYTPIAQGDSTVTTIQSLVQNAKRNMISKLDGLLTEFSASHSSLENTEAEWNNEFKEIESRYYAHVRTEGGDYQELAGQNARLQQQRIELESQLSNANAKKDLLQQVRQSRNETLDRLTQVYDDFREERKIRCKYFEVKSLNRLELGIDSQEDRREYKERLLGLKTGSLLREPDIDAIVERCEPRLLVDKMIDFWISIVNPSRSNASDALQEIASKSELDMDKIQKLANVLTDEEKLQKLLELQYKAYPQDRPEIKLKVGDGKYSPLDSLSVGQKSTALLIMALTDGDMPVVIDQPEDSLDIASIWEDICSKVRLNKSKRQFVFTTHNSNVAVASDSDNFIIMEANSDSGRIVQTGSMDHSPVDDKVLRYMEGGTEPYGKKFRKYGADRRPELLSR